MNKEIYYNLLNKGLYALTYESNQNKKAVLLEIKSFCSQTDYEYATNKMRSDYDLQGTTHIDNLLPHEINQNLQAFCEALWQKIQNQNNYAVSFNAINSLYSRNIYFKTDILYQTNEQALNVSDLLDAIGYGLAMANIIFDIDTEKYENYITVLKGLDKILNNDKPANPLKDLDYVLDVFYKIQNHFETNPDKKRENKIEALAVSLFIKFLTE